MPFTLRLPIFASYAITDFAMPPTPLRAPPYYFAAIAAVSPLDAMPR